MMHKAASMPGVSNFLTNCRYNDDGGGGNDEEEEEDKDEEDDIKNQVSGLLGGSVSKESI